MSDKNNLKNAEGRQREIDRIWEEQVLKEEKIEQLACEIKDKRTKNEIFYEWEKIDKMLRENGIEPGSVKANEYMEKWDLEEAKTLYEEGELFKSLTKIVVEPVIEKEKINDVIKTVEKNLKTQVFEWLDKRYSEGLKDWYTKKYPLENFVQGLLEREKFVLTDLKNPQELVEEWVKIKIREIEIKEGITTEENSTEESIPPEPPEKSGEMAVEELELELEKKRNDYVKVYKGYKKNEEEYDRKVELTKENYDKAKEELGNKMLENGATSAEIFKKLILDEIETLNKAKVESWPPKEKNIFRKGLEWYMRDKTAKGIAKRLLISTAILAGVAYGASFVGLSGLTIAGMKIMPSTAGLFGVSRFIRMGGGILAGQLARATGGGIDHWLTKIDEVEKEEKFAELGKDFILEKIKQKEDAVREILEKYVKKTQNRQLAIGIISVAAGIGGSIGMGMAEHAWVGAGAEPSTPTEPETDTTGTEPGTDTTGTEPGTDTLTATKEELATIHKGEGIEHTFIRQLIHEPEKFGCPQEIIDKGSSAVRHWAEGNAHRIAIDQGYVDGGQETRVFWDPNKKIQYILDLNENGDVGVQEVETKGMEYIYTHPEQEIVPEPKQELVPELKQELVPEPKQVLVGTGTTEAEPGTEPGTGTTEAEPETESGTKTPTKIPAELLLNQKVENIGQEIDKQTRGIFGGWFGDNKNWDFYKKQEVSEFQEWWNAKNKGLPDLSKFEWRGAEGGHTETAFREKLGYTIGIFGDRPLAEGDKHLTILQYMKKVLK